MTTTALPGTPMPSGFDNWRPATGMSPEAKARVLAKMESVDRARAAAYVASLTAVVGMTAPVLPEPTDETVEAHMREWHVAHLCANPLGCHVMAHRAPVDPDGTPAFGHTHERP